MDIRNIKLVTPTKHHETLCEDFVQAVKTSDGVFAGTSSIESMAYKEWLERIHYERKGERLQKGRVPATTLLAIIDNTLVGFINIRHTLNAFLHEAGGHIGYMVHPRYRKRGIATKMLEKALNYCAMELQIKNVLITCDPDNTGSKNTIINNGGRYENTVHNAILGTVERYWINLKEQAL